jgi:hypothetical protein
MLNLRDVSRHVGRPAKSRSGLAFSGKPAASWQDGGRTSSRRLAGAKSTGSSRQHDEWSGLLHRDEISDSRQRKKSMGGRDLCCCNKAQWCRNTDWTDSVCNRTDMLWIKQTDGNFKFPACLFINHSHPVWTNVPNNEFDKTIFDWYRVNKIELPKTALAVGYRKYFSGDYVTVRFDINPELVGFSPDTGNSRASSQWHPDLIKEDAGKVRYVDALQKWAETMEIPYRNSLRSGSPGDNKLGLWPESR